MSLADDIRMLNDLNSTIRAILANDICSAQALDVAVDRNRVQKEIVKGLTEKYTFTLKSKPIAEPTYTYRCPECGDETAELTQGEIDNEEWPSCSSCGCEMQAD